MIAYYYYFFVENGNHKPKYLQFPLYSSDLLFSTPLFLVLCLQVDEEVLFVQIIDVNEFPPNITGQNEAEMYENDTETTLQVCRTTKFQMN